MTVQSLRIVDTHQNVSYYSYSDHSGSYESIKTIAGESNAYKALHALSMTQSVEKQWNGLSTGAKIGIACGIVGAFVVALIAFVFYCLKQRRAGKREKAVADQAWDAQHSELMEYRNRMARGDFAIRNMGHVRSQTPVQFKSVG